jgi:hypothetical protein
MACSTSRQERASWPITSGKAFGSPSAASTRLIAICSGSSLAVAMKIPWNTGRSTSRKNGWCNLGLKIERLPPGGHLTTNEQPQALAAFIARFAMADQPIRHLTLRVQEADFDAGHMSRVLCLFQGFRTLAGYAGRQTRRHS